MLWTAFLLLNGLLLLLLLYTTRKRRTHEPPLDRGFIPWLGHALAFQKDAAKFLAEMKRKHGDIFTVLVAGNYVTVLLEPHSFDALLNDTLCLDSTRSRNRVVQRVFGLQLPGVGTGAERQWMERHFQGVSLSRLSSSMSVHLHSLLGHEQNGFSQSEWRQEGLFSLCYRLLFRAGYLTLFERSENAAEVYAEFRKFDDLLAKLARCSLKRGESKTASSSRERLWELLAPRGLGGAEEEEEEEAGCWHHGYRRFLQREGADAEMQRRASLMQLWTTQCNAGPAAFWLLGFLLTHPEAMEALQSEIRGLAPQRPHVQPEEEERRTPVFDSILKETLRLTAAVLITREVVRDKTLSMADGREYQLRRGDKVCVFPLLSPQTDPQIHPQPQTFKYNRFLNDDLTAKDTFYKDGKRLKYPSMPWGAGSGVCVGREFAVTAIKKFVFLLLTRLDLEVCDPEAKLPPADAGRCGFGMLQPDGDLQVRYRLRRLQQH